MKLIYHPPVQTSPSVSPFDAVIMEMVAGKHVRIACPYLNVEYLLRVVKKAKSWKLLTDAAAWLQSHEAGARSRVSEFILANHELVHHCPDLHAKVVMTESAALIGSANLTDKGIMQRTEMGVIFDGPESIEELQKWFDSLWQQTRSVSQAELSALAQRLPVNPPVPSPGIASPFRGVRSRLIPTPPAPGSTASSPDVHALLARQSADVRRYAEQLMDILGNHADQIDSTKSNKGDIRFWYGGRLFAEIIFARSWLTLVLTVPLHSITDRRFRWNQLHTQPKNRLDRGRVKLTPHQPIPMDWIIEAIDYSRRIK